MERLISFIIGGAIGYVAGLLLLVFFKDEIFGFIDRLVYRVRKICGLEP